MSGQCKALAKVDCGPKAIIEQLPALRITCYVDYIIDYLRFHCDFLANCGGEADIADGNDSGIDKVLLFLLENADHEVQSAKFDEFIAVSIAVADVGQRPLRLKLQLLEHLLVDEAVQHHDRL